MSENLLIEVLKQQGVPTFLIGVAILVMWRWILPEWRSTNERKLDLEEKRQAEEVTYREQLRSDQRLDRNEHREERKQLMDAHRVDIQSQYIVFSEMITSIRSGLDANSREIAKNSALTVAAAEVMGASRQCVKARASQLAGEDIDIDLAGLPR